MFVKQFYGINTSKHLKNQGVPNGNVSYQLCCLVLVILQ